MYLNLEIERAPEYLKKAFEESQRQFVELNEKAGQGTEEERLKTAQQLRELMNKGNTSYVDAINYYVHSFEERPLDVLEDVAEILEAIEKEDFLVWIRDKKSIQDDLSAEELTPEIKKKIEMCKDLKEDYKSALIFFRELLTLQIEVLTRFNNGDWYTLPDMIRTKAGKWYKPTGEDNNIIMPVSDVPAVVITHEKFEYALTNKQNPIAQIVCMSGNQLTMDIDEHGEMFIKQSKKYTPAELLKLGYNGGLFNFILGMTLKKYLEKNRSHQPITVSVGEFARAINADYRASNLNGNMSGHKGTNLIELINKNKEFYGVLDNNPDKKIAMLLIKSFDNKTMTFESPYCQALIDLMNADPAKEVTDSKGNIVYSLPGYTFTKPSIATARNKKTVAVVNHLVAGLTRRGTIPQQTIRKGKKYNNSNIVYYEVSLKTLINSIPIIKETLEIKSNESPKEKTRELKRIFGDGKKNTLMDYIKKYTLLYDKYINLNISIPIPAWSYIDDQKIIITHEGIRGEFKSPYFDL